MNARLLLFALFPLSAFAARLNYDVRFYGLDNKIVLEELNNSSELISLKERPPATVNGLRYRVKSDIPKMLKILKAYAYFDAEIDYEIEEGSQGLQVDLFIHSGPQYTLGSYEVFQGDCTDPMEIPQCGDFCPERLGLALGAVADSLSIVSAEMALLGELARCGYPLAYIDKRRVLVDVASKTVEAAACVQEGPLSRFGPVTIFGLKSISPRLIDRNIAWKEGDVFNSDFVDETQERLLKSELFSSVLVTHSEEIDEAGELSMKIRLSEAKQRSLSLGVFYATVDGPGATFSWTHKNLTGRGDRLSLEGDVSWIYYAGTVSYLLRDFLEYNQNFLALAEMSRENIDAYHATLFRQLNRIEKQIDKQRTFSIGLQAEWDQVQNSANNGIYWLLGLPIFGKYTTADSPMDPTKGYTIAYLAVPYQSLKSSTRFILQTLTTNFYVPLTPGNRVIFAAHAVFGSFLGASREDIPLNLLFLGGSEDDLRGYSYKTVCPVNENGDLLGGRSAIFSTLELRFRITSSIGFVPFLDLGTVTEEETPQIGAKWYKSVGAGIRYYTFFGPLRFDVGFPLNKLPGRAQHRETWGKIYASIGQSF